MKNNIRDTNNKELQEIIANTILLPTTIYLWLISLTASKELSILLLKLLEC